MATKGASLRLVLETVNDTGDTPAKSVDETFDLTSFTDLTPGRRIALATTADDQPVAFSDAIGVVVLSHDYPFGIRLAAGETLMSNVRLFVVYADDENAGVLTGSFLLTGNGTNVADIEVWLIEAP